MAGLCVRARRVSHRYVEFRIDLFTLADGLHLRHAPSWRLRWVAFGRLLLLRFLPR